MTSKTCNNIIACLLFLLCCNISNAQITIEKMDEVAKLVCKLEAETEDSIYNDGKNDYKLSFPEESFGFNFTNGKAWKAVYKKNGNDTYLAITENIDLSLVTGFTWDRSYTSRVIMHFPKGAIKTLVSKNGGVPYMLDEDYLEFFCTDDLKMLLPLGEVCHKLKVAKKIIIEPDIKRFEQEFSALMELNTLDVDVQFSKYNDYVQKNEKSLFVPILKAYIKVLNDYKQYQMDSKIAKLFCDSLCNAFLYKPDLYSAISLEKFNPQTKKLLKNKNYTSQRNSNGQWYTQFTILGPCNAEFRSKGLIYYYSFGQSPIGTDLFGNRIKWLEARISKSFFATHSTANGDKYIHIQHHKKDPCLSFYISSYDGIPYEMIQFSPTEYNTMFHY